MENTSFYRTIWRWHFYASLFVMPLRCSSTLVTSCLAHLAYRYSGNLKFGSSRAAEPPSLVLQRRRKGAQYAAPASCAP